MSNPITFTDKVENGGTTAEGIVSAANINEIKTKHNLVDAALDTEITNRISAVSAAVVSSNGYTDAKVEGLQHKNPVDACATGNIVLSGIQTIDGVTTPSSVLLPAQTDAKENGIYVPSSGEWVRRSDMNANAEIPLARVEVKAGTVNGGKIFKCTNTTVILGTTNITFSESVIAGLQATSEKGNANGYAGLDAGGKVPLAQLPAIPVSVAVKTGSVISFESLALYNTPSTPGSGTISYDFTGAAVGTEVIAYFNHASEPVFPAGTYKVGTWNPSNLNVVRFVFKDSSNVSVTVLSALGTTNNNDSRLAFIKPTIDSSTTGTTAVDITDMTIPMAANSKYLIEVYIGFRNTSGGTKFGFLAPSAWVVNHVREGNTTASTAYLLVSSTDTTSLFSSQAWGAYTAAAPTSATYRFTAIVETNATPGNLKMQFGSVTSGQTTTILSDRSFIKSTKLS